MKKTILILTLALGTFSASAAQVIEGIIVRVGDRIVTRTQYEKRLRDLYAEIDAAGRPEQASAARETARKNLVNELISELLIKDRADRLGLTVTNEEIKDAIGRSSSPA